MTAPYPAVPPSDPYGQHNPTGPYHPYGAPSYGAPYGPPLRRVANPIGIVVALAGGLLALVGCFVDWYGTADVKQIVRATSALNKDFPHAYFSWLMFVVLAATVVAGLLANLPGGLGSALRIISPILGVIGALGVFLALNDLVEQGSVFDNSELGLYLTLIGFVVAGVGGAFGARRVP